MGKWREKTNPLLPKTKKKATDVGVGWACRRNCAPVDPYLEGGESRKGELNENEMGKGNTDDDERVSRTKSGITEKGGCVSVHGRDRR